jgi:glutathione S-transferase
VTDPPLLWHLKVSHYNEKARWALDYKGVPHQRSAAHPGAHRSIARKLTGTDKFPVLVLDGEPIADSTRIIAELERRFPDPPLYPPEGQDRERALELEDFFDEELGPYTRMLVLHATLPDPDLLFGTFTPDLAGFQRLIARVVYPQIKRRTVSDFSLDESHVAEAHERVRAAGERFWEELGSSGYLVGDEFTVADLTAAALIAPVICPPEFPYPQPQRDHPRLERVRQTLAECGMSEWALGVYARHRGLSAEVSSGKVRVA